MPDVSKDKKIVLGELIGATDLALTNEVPLSSLHPFVIASLIEKNGEERVLQRTKRRKETDNPIWCVEHRCFFLIEINTDLSKCTDDRVLFDVRSKDSMDPFRCSRFGTQSLSLRDIYKICEDQSEERIELQLESPVSTKSKKILCRSNTPSSKEAFDVTKVQPMNDSTKSVQSTKSKNLLAVRFRFATSKDLAFMEELAEQPKQGKIVSILSEATKNIHRTFGLEDKEVLASEQSTNDLRISNYANVFAKKTIRGKDGVRRNRVQPYFDRKRENETTYLSEKELESAMLESSTEWIQCGTRTEASLGKVYLEILQCEGLPNMDSGEVIGNKTDAFVTVVYEESLVQTDVIDDRLSPIWPSWSKRAFIFNMHHPYSQVFVAVNDFDVGNSPHDGIGRIAINMNHFKSDVVYTLKYNIHPAANVYDRDGLGSITIRLRKEIYDEKKFLLAALQPMPKLHVNMKCEKTLPVANFALYGEHNEDKYDIQLLKSYVYEMLDLKRDMKYVVKDSLSSLVMWRGQVKISEKVYLPIHSMIAFTVGTYVIERPHLLPSCFFLTLAWIMLASMTYRHCHPSPWHHTVNFTDYFHMLTERGAPERKMEIRKSYNKNEIEKFICNWEHRLKTDYDASWKEWELQLEMDRIGCEDLNTEEKKTISTDPYALAYEQLKPRLFPIQKRLRGYCDIIRTIKSVTTWEESLISFWITFTFLAIGIILLIIPAVAIIHWILRVIVWVGMGPWFRLYTELKVMMESGPGTVDPLQLNNKKDRENHHKRTFSQIHRKFKEQYKDARKKGEEALKMKAMRVFRFGKYIAKVPRKYSAKHYDYPLPDSYAKHIALAPFPEPKNITVVGAQYLQGEMIPLTEDEAKEIEVEKKQLSTFATENKDQSMGGKRNIESSLLEPLLEGTEVEYDSSDEDLNIFLSFDSSSAESKFADGKSDVRMKLVHSNTDSTNESDTDTSIEEYGIEVIACEKLRSTLIQHGDNTEKESGIEMEMIYST